MRLDTHAGNVLHAHLSSDVYIVVYYVIIIITCILLLLLPLLLFCLPKNPYSFLLFYCPT